MTYKQRIAAIKDKYNDRAIKILAGIRDDLLAEKFECDEPEFMDGDLYKWSMIASRPGCGDDEKRLDISISLVEQQEFEGEGEGITFRWDMIEWGGAILGEIAPYNYTSDVWVDSTDEQAVEVRFGLIEQADYDCLAEDLLKEHST